MPHGKNRFQYQLQWPSLLIGVRFANNICGGMDHWASWMEWGAVHMILITEKRRLCFVNTSKYTLQSTF